MTKLLKHYDTRDKGITCLSDSVGVVRQVDLSGDLNGRDTVMPRCVERHSNI